MTGGWDIFSNEFLIHKTYDNLDLLRGLVKWSFGQSGILKAGELIHKRVIIFKYILLIGWINRDIPPKL
jgi:hypothetical protein